VGNGRRSTGARYVGVAAALAAVVSGCGHSGGSGRFPAASASAGTTGTVAVSPAGCAAGRLSVTWSPGQPTAVELCVRVGTEVVVNLHADGSDRWGQPTSSAPAVAGVNPAGYDQDGGTHVTVSAESPGTAVIASRTAAREWRLRVTVVP
jgi:hypothetical protein